LVFRLTKKSKVNLKKLSVVVPYRNREKHLAEFVPFMEEFLSEQKIPFHVFVVHQLDQKPFNRAKLLNIGFSLSFEFDYHAFHDVDMLPLDADYSYVEEPTHLASQVEQFSWGLPYEGYFGGVTLFNQADFRKINGFSNDYWGWGAEDDDLLTRCMAVGLDARRREGRYISLSHDKAPMSHYQDNLKKLRKLRSSNVRGKLMEDGLNSLEFREVRREKITEKTTMIDVEI